MISIIIPIYNAEVYLNDCLKSIKSQTYSNYEVICVDDGSTDKSSQICHDWIKKDSRFQYHYQTNAGVSAARNKGIEIASGEYICFVDADDMIHEDFLTILLSYAQSKETVVCEISRGKGWGESSKYQSIPVRTFISDIIYERIAHPGFTCFLYDKLILTNNNIKFIEGCVRNEDYEFYMKYLAATTGNVAMLDYKGYFYRVNEGSEMESPISMKTLTSIEASSRINSFLYDLDIIQDESVVLSNGILTYIYSTSKQRNKYIYTYIHQHYDVKKAMNKMIYFPKLSKRLVAVLYLVLGKNLFYKVISCFFSALQFFK